MTSADAHSTAIIGAGVSGLTCARLLAAAGMPVQVFDKSRGPSGRLSTRRRDGRHWDHGAPYFEARHHAFVAECATWQDAGVVVQWGPPNSWVGHPRMSALGRHLARGLALHTSCRVDALVHTPGGIQVLDTEGTDRGCFARVVVATPAPQAVPLLRMESELQKVAQGASMVPGHALLLELPQPLSDVPPLLHPTAGPLARVVRNAAKPGRPGAECWVAHTTPEWSRQFLEQDPSTLVDELTDAFSVATGQSMTPVQAQVHRWRFAQTEGSEGAWPDGFGISATHSLGVCGDWCAGVGVEAAWLSGRRLAQALLTAAKTG